MKYFKDKILPILIVSFIIGIISWLGSIFSGILTIIYPSLKELPISLCLKIILFLSIFLLITVSIVLILYNKSKEFKPFRKKGKYQGFNWVANIKEYDPHQGWDIWINFICPIHKVYLGAKDAEVPECCYSVLWCSHCNKQYPIYIKGDIIHLEEAKRNIEDEVISTLRVANK